MTTPARALSLASALVLAIAAPAGAKVSFQRIAGFKSPGTPAKYDKVGILKIGSPKRAQRPRPQPRDVGERGVLRAAGAGASSPRRRSWQVWAVERRENLLEDQSVFDRAKAGQATPQQVFDYYLGWINEQLDHVARAADPGQRGRLRAGSGG